MSADKRAVLRREIERRRAAATTVRAIQARPPGTPPVLSLAQERLWVLDQMYPGQSTYNATLTLRLQGRLDTAALQAQGQGRVVRRLPRIHLVEHPQSLLREREDRWRSWRARLDRPHGRCRCTATLDFAPQHCTPVGRHALLRMGRTAHACPASDPSSSWSRTC